MKLEPDRLERLIEVHDKIIAWHLETIAGLEVAIADCDTQQARTLASMHQIVGMGLAKGPNYTRILQEIRDRKAKFVKASVAAKAEHARVTAIVERLNERKGEAQELIDQLELEDAIDEWSNAQASFS
jgi:hypothetical protein